MSRSIRPAAGRVAVMSSVSGASPSPPTGNSSTPWASTPISTSPSWGGEDLTLSVTGVDATCDSSGDGAWCSFELTETTAVNLTIQPSDPVACSTCADLEGDLTLYDNAG